MNRPGWFLVLLIAGVMAPLGRPVSAQRTGTVEVGLFAQRTAFDELTTLAFGTAPGIGGRLGLYVYPNLLLAATTSFTWSETAADPSPSVSWVPFRATIAYQLPVTENFYPMAGVGWVRNGYGDGLREADNGVTALAGFKTYLRDRWSFRSDVTIDWISSPFNQGESVSSSAVSKHVNWSLAAGLSLDIGPGRYSDRDGDLVYDHRDACPDTPRGVGVDESGCRLDEDGDRIFDEDDACAATPAGVRVDLEGCRVDGDRDSVFDEDDVCPNTPEGVAVDPSGCALDTDGDRVPDHRDLCAATPAGVGVDGRGCRLDGDQDGVFDEDDLCRDTSRGVEVDTSGCEVLFVREESVVVLEGVTFETASADLTASATEVLDAVAESLLRSPDVRVRVVGHTDSVGLRSYNLTLSEDRAASVVRYLTERGVAAERLESAGFGPDRPVATNETEEGRRMNRRVELERIN
ncbi:MAG: OmpA family protein [Gemmatimonadota bacterium]|nr:OmpA family protein [Gemmatimonadota bacterium]